MKITVEAADIFHDLMPEGHDDGLMDIDVPEGTTPLGAMRRLGFPVDGHAYMLIVNNKTVPSSQQDSLTLSEGDELAILLPLKGG